MRRAAPCLLAALVGCGALDRLVPTAADVPAPMQPVVARSPRADGTCADRRERPTRAAGGATLCYPAQGASAPAAGPIPTPYDALNAAQAPAATRVDVHGDAGIVVKLH